MTGSSSTRDRCESDDPCLIERMNDRVQDLVQR